VSRSQSWLRRIRCQIDQGIRRAKQAPTSSAVADVAPLPALGRHALGRIGSVSLRGDGYFGDRTGLASLSFRRLEGVVLEDRHSGHRRA
jgi:hypothetical protein